MLGDLGACSPRKIRPFEITSGVFSGKITPTMNGQYYCMVLIYSYKAFGPTGQAMARLLFFLC